MLENALPISISQLSSCLKDADIEIELFDTTFYKWGSKSATERRIEALQIKPCPIMYREGNIFEAFLEKIEMFAPDLIGISVVEPTFNLGLKMLNSAKDIIRENGILVAMGGIHTIMAPGTVSLTDPVDFICISEGEVAFVELCQKLKNDKSIKDHTGFWIRDGDRWQKNGLAPVVNLETLPILDFELFSPDYLDKPMMGQLYRTISIELTRGCPYNCSYCCDHSLTRKFRPIGKWFRRKSIKKIEDEMNAYVAKYAPQFIYMMSESFLAGYIERARDFFDVYKSFSLPFWFNTRPEDISPEKTKLAKESGCVRVSIGIESGNEEYRCKVMHRKVSNQRIQQAASILHEYDISFSVNIIIGSPNETREMVFDSIELARLIKADAVSTHIYNPYHGTELREISVEKGYIRPNMIADDFFHGYVLNGGPLNALEIEGLFRTIPLYVYLPKSEYPRIRKAEKFDDKGNRLFAELKEEYYNKMNWEY